MSLKSQNQKKSRPVRPSAPVESLEDRQLLSASLRAALPAGVTARDVAFVQKAASGGMLEVALGNLAQTNASSQQVKAAGARMVADHTVSNAMLAQDAATLGIPLPTTLNRADQAVLNRFRRLTGSAFDVADSAYGVLDHKQEIANYTFESRTTGSTLLKTYADANIPVLQSHEVLWQQSQITSRDLRFIQDINSDNSLEIRLGQLAQTNASSAQVKAAGQRMVSDHSVAAAMLTQIATQMGVTLLPVTSLNGPDQAVFKHLNTVTGSKFDLADARLMANDHVKDIVKYTREGQVSTNVPLKDFITTNIPILQSHLSLWETVLGTLK